MKTQIAALLLLSSLGLSVASAGGDVKISSPGLAPSTVNEKGQLVEDWGVVDVRISGSEIVAGKTNVSPVKLENLVPAASVSSDLGPIQMTREIYRAPIFPAGVDVLRVKLEETRGKAIDVSLAVVTKAATQLGNRTVRVGGRTVLVLPREVTDKQPLLDWGYCDEASSLPGWARPNVPCDPAFRNIRAGMGGVPIVYRFAVTPGGQADLLLGFCESHWREPGQRPLVCRVEGAPSQTVDPVAKWGQHKPGLLSFQARDQNNDGRLDVRVQSAAFAPDGNPILNAIWVLPQGQAPPEDEVLAGQWNETAQYYVDVGGKGDQSIFPPSKIEFPLHLAAGGATELTFLVACPGASAPIPSLSQWQPARLFDAACDVWRDWNVEAE